LYIYLRRKLSYWNDRDFLWPVAKIVAAAFLAGVIAQISKAVFALTTDELDTFLEVFLQLLAGIIIGGGTYIALCGAFAVEEMGMFRKLFIHRLLRQPETLAKVEDHPERGDW
jgi:peptidoglycan biosynthesis protein MviN/MurJ (putative lipid II flippase)